MVAVKRGLATAHADRRQQLRRRIRTAERTKNLKAAALIVPVFLFIVVFFLVPILSMLALSVSNTEIPKGLPRTVKMVQGWDGTGLPPNGVATALIEDVEAMGRVELGTVAKRLNYNLSGFRSLLFKTAKGLEKEADWEGSPLTRLVGIDSRWGERRYWAAIRNSSEAWTDFYLLAALDLKRDDDGRITPIESTQAIYLDIYRRTFIISLVVTVACLLLGYPIAYLLANSRPSRTNLLMILVLLPFWTSLLVRTTAWVVLLQREGIVNDVALKIGLFPERLQLAHNRFGVYVAMVHILLPFMVLPIYSVMKGISASHMRAAFSLGAHPVLAFRAVYLPQTIPGVAAGCLLVFILALGYYITPALVGGPKDQLVSYFIALLIDRTVNWGMAAALSVILLVFVTGLFVAYNRFIGIDKIKLT